jgi:hypothetical protein
MRTVKTTILAIAAVIGAFCAVGASAQTIIGVVTNYDKLSISLTVSTNAETKNEMDKKGGLQVQFRVRSQRLETKDIMNLLAGPDFANTTWPKYAMLVIGLDQEWSNDVLVVDRTGTNVLYDASADPNANFTINYFRYTGTWQENFDGDNPGSEQYTWYNNGYFEIYDNKTMNIDLWGYGASTERFSLDWNNLGVNTGWSDSEYFGPQSAAQTFNGYSQGTLSGSINASGRGKGTPETLIPTF